MRSRLEHIYSNVPGKVSFYYKNLVNQEVIAFNENQPLIAASIIKIPVLIEILKMIERGDLNADERVTILDKHKLPSCGALTYMDEGLEVTLRDLYTLMIIHSDNTATNILIDMAGIDNINSTLEDLGSSNSKLNRLLFDSQAQKRGLENYITSYDMGIMLEQIYRKDILTERICQEIERVMKLQRLNSKIPYLLPKNLVVGHKTGEDSGITHDMGIIYGENPFVFCFASNETDVIKAEKALREMALICYEGSLK